MNPSPGFALAHMRRARHVTNGQPIGTIEIHATGWKMFGIEYAVSVADDLARLRAHHRKRILDQIDEQLTHQPTEETRNKKIVPGLVPPWEHEEPVWELRIGEFRVFYDVNEDTACVTVRAIRQKPPHKTTEEIL